MNVIYYVVEKKLVKFGGVEETTGNKRVTAYTVEGNALEKFFDLELQNSDNSEKEINNYLDDNGYGDDEWGLKIL